MGCCRRRPQPQSRCHDDADQRRRGTGKYIQGQAVQPRKLACTAAPVIAWRHTVSAFWSPPVVGVPPTTTPRRASPRPVGFTRGPPRDSRSGVCRGVFVLSAARRDEAPSLCPRARSPPPPFPTFRGPRRRRRCRRASACSTPSCVAPAANHRTPRPQFRVLFVACPRSVPVAGVFRSVRRIFFWCSGCLLFFG